MTRHLSPGSRPPLPAFGRSAPGRLLSATHCALLLSAALVCLAGSAAQAQENSAEVPPAHISFVDGAVVLERDGRPDTSPASMPLLAGDRIRTRAGRVEVLFADGSALHVDHHTVVDFQSDEVLRLIEGRVRLSIPGRARDLAYRIDAPGGWVQIAEAGEYRVAVLRGEREPQVELAVLRGAAELVNEDGRSFVRAGERAFARAGAQPSSSYVFNSAAWDAFDRWSESRRDERLGASAQYLPPDVHPYSTTFDNYGSWRHEQAYGYVWYPRVTVGWRPYYHGRWVSLRPYGWTWIAGDPWGWPTHHYGRWGFSAGSWFWIPGRRWGPAWVSWAYAPDYVSWCPLGWNDRPVFSFVNVSLNYYGGRRYDPWHAWTVVPRRHFSSGFVNVNVVAGRRLDGRTRGSFVVRDTAPEWRSDAVPRSSAPIRTAGRSGYAVPRGTATGALSGAGARDSISPDTRSFPAASREPRAPSAAAGAASRSAAPVTGAPDRAVPRDRRLQPGTFGSPSDERSAPRAPAYRSAPDAHAPADRGRTDQPSTPPAGSRAVPRRTPGGEPHAITEPAWGRSDRPGSRSAPRSVPSYRPDAAAPPDAGYRRAPDNGANDRYRAVPRTDAPRPSSEPQRTMPSYRPEGGAPPDAGYRRAPDGGGADRYRAVPRQDSPRPSADAPRPEPRSSGAAPPREGRPSSYGAPERRAPSAAPPSADRPSRSDPPAAGTGDSRSRGGQPSSGQAVRRPRG